MTTTNHEYELTVLIPCLNEAETIAVCVKKALESIRKHNIRGEVNGSTDNSRYMASACGARVVPVKDKGYGAALQGGIKAAKGNKG